MSILSWDATELQQFAEELANYAMAGTNKALADQHKRIRRNLLEYQDEHLTKAINEAKEDGYANDRGFVAYIQEERLKNKDEYLDLLKRQNTELEEGLTKFLKGKTPGEINRIRQDQYRSIESFVFEKMPRPTVRPFQVDNGGQGILVIVLENCKQSIKQLFTTLNGQVSNLHKDNILRACINCTLNHLNAWLRAQVANQINPTAMMNLESDILQMLDHLYVSNIKHTNQAFENTKQGLRFDSIDDSNPMRIDMPVFSVGEDELVINQYFAVLVAQIDVAEATDKIAPAPMAKAREVLASSSKGNETPITELITAHSIWRGQIKTITGNYSPLTVMATTTPTPPY